MGTSNIGIRHDTWMQNLPKRKRWEPSNSAIQAGEIHISHRQSQTSLVQRPSNIPDAIGLPEFQALLLSSAKLQLLRG
jgi:hypothetical protein